jgi:hypothetical protein
MSLSNSNIEIGDRVIVRYNEDEPLWAGIIEGFQDLGELNVTPFPIIKCEETGKMWLCMGIVKLYSPQLLQELTPLSPKEQWNLLAKNYKR